MDFFDNIKDIIQLDDEIALFECGENGYYAYLRSGRRLDIQRVFNFQPPIENFDDYFSYMFVQSLQGFFLLRQRMLENRPLNWRVFLEFRAAEPHLLFDQAWELALSIRRKLGDFPN